VQLKRPDRCKLAQKLLDAIWGPDGINTSSGRMMLVCLGGLDGIVHRWASGRDGSIVRTADKEFEFF
jgi:hypothetical protein